MHASNLINYTRRAALALPLLCSPYPSPARDACPPSFALGLRRAETSDQSAALPTTLLRPSQHAPRATGIIPGLGGGFLESLAGMHSTQYTPQCIYSIDLRYIYVRVYIICVCAATCEWAIILRRALLAAPGLHLANVVEQTDNAAAVAPMRHGGWPILAFFAFLYLRSVPSPSGEGHIPFLDNNGRKRGEGAGEGGVVLCLRGTGQVCLHASDSSAHTYQSLGSCAAHHLNTTNERVVIVVAVSV